jgi:hypothetical protein
MALFMILEFCKHFVLQESVSVMHRICDNWTIMNSLRETDSMYLHE